jgi:hypothetical protein
MADHHLSTRDLANRTDSDDGTNPSKEREPQFENAPLDEPLMRERVTEGDPSNGGDTRAPTHGELRASATSAFAVEPEPLLPLDQSDRFTMRWQEIQSSFVDQPRDSVAEADALVADLMQKLAAGFSNERERLEAQWDKGDDVSTEDLRVALTRYRSFFDRLLSA